MANNSPEEALAGMARVGNPRQPMGTTAYASVVNASVPGPTEKVAPRRNRQAGDPTAPGTKRNKSNRLYERMGAHYGISVNYAPPVSIEASSTQANGRIVRSVVNRSRPNFDDGVRASEA